MKMALVERGKVQGGGIVFSEPLKLPEGTEVLVRVEPLTMGEQTITPSDSDEFSTLPFFGMWADRQDMSDSTAWVRREREKWQR
jgi:hypothetical protein